MPIGGVTKNGIFIVEFANRLKAAGLGGIEAVLSQRQSAPHHVFSGMDQR